MSGNRFLSVVKVAADLYTNLDLAERLVEALTNQLKEAVAQMSDEQKAEYLRAIK